MSALVGLMLSLLTATRGVIAAFGCLCIVLHAVIPCLTVVGELVVHEIPAEVGKWKLLKAQQAELQALEDHLTVLKKRRAREKRHEAQRAHEEYQMQANRRHEAQKRKQAVTTQRVSVDAEEHVQSRVSRLRQPTVRAPIRPEAEKTSLPTRRPSRPLQLLSPNVPVDRRPVSAYVKASAGVIKHVDDSDRDRSRRAASQKARLLSLGNIFDEVDEENVAPKPRITRYAAVYTLFWSRLCATTQYEPTKMDSAIILLCGIPGAGKTTLARQLCDVPYAETKSEELWGFAERVVVERIIFDELYEGTTALTATFDPALWKHTQDEMARIVKERLTQSRNGEASVCRVLLVDDNFYYRSMRKRFYHIAQDDGHGFGIIHVATPEDICRKRNISRKGASRVPDEQFERMVRAFEPPNGSFGFESNVVVIDDAGELCDHPAIAREKAHAPTLTESLPRLLHQAAKHLDAAQLARQAENAQLCQQIEDQERTAENAVHNFDLVSRKWISSVLNGDDAAFEITSSKEKAALAKALNQRRKGFLLELKAANPATAPTTRLVGIDPLQLLERFRADMIREYWAA